MWARFAAVTLLGLLSVPVAAQPATPVPQAAPSPQWLGMVTLARPELHDPARWSERETAISTSHFNYWVRLTKAGSVILVGRTLDEDARGHLAPDAVGLMIFEAPDRDAAERTMADDPGVKGGLWRYRLDSYRVALTR